MSKNFEPMVEALRQLTEKAKAGRLAAADDQAGTAAFRDLLLAGGKASSAALELLGDLPWYIPVNGTVEAWPQLTPARKRTFLTALRRLQTELSLRMRLSIARGLLKVDAENALKLIVSTLQEMHKGGSLEARDRSAVFNVLIGKTKPWLLQLDLSKQKPAEAKLVAVCALEASATASPPAAFSVIDWAKPYANLADLNPNARTEVGKTLAKWAGRWQKQISKLELPDDIRQQLAAAPPKGREPANAAPAPAATATAPEAPVENQSPPAAAAPETPSAPSREAAPPAPAEGRRDHRPAPRHPPKSSGKENLGISDLLRQIEQRFEQVKGELHAARQQIRNASTTNGSGSGGGHPNEVAKLREENTRLAENIRQLRETLNELAEDHFDVAISRRADTDRPEGDPLSQYKALLTIKLREEITRFQAVNRENQVDGLPLLLENVLNVLEMHGIDLSNLQPPPAPAKRRY